jgi:hypothetical protein
MGGMTDLPSPSPARAIEVSRGLVLTPGEIVARKRNRRWLLIIAISSIVVLVAALIASGVANSNTPSGPKVVAPTGYQAVHDGYFSYVVPSGWSTNQAFTDSAGDVDRSGSTGWTGEHIGYRTTAPALYEPQPASLAAFGMSRAEPYTLTGGRPIQIPGASTAFSYDMTRPGGFHAPAVNAWNDRYGVELWLVIDASPEVTAQILNHLTA